MELAKKNRTGSHAGTIILLCIVLTVITVTVFLQVGNFPFITLDDIDYVTNNPKVANGITGNNIFWAFTSVDAANWHPITWLSHMADVQLYGMNPRGHHLTSVGIHSVSSVLLLILLSRLTGSLWQSSFVAALFALHPLHVESVAWVAERKEVLSALFGFLTLLLYSEYVAKPKTFLYVLCLFSFVLGLMSKPMLVTLPFVMLLMDLWPLDRYRYCVEQQGIRQHYDKITSLIKEKIPFFVCSFLSCLITMYAQSKGGTISSIGGLPPLLRIENALVAYIKYLVKVFWPHDLAVMYPFPASIPPWQVISSLLVLLIISIAAVRVGRRYPYLPMGWFWFLVTLVPVVGLIQVGEQSMADRYSYFPLTGLFIIIAWGIPDLATGLKYRNTILALFAATTIIAAAIVTWQQLGYWRDSVSLFRHANQVTPNSFVNHKFLGIALADRGHYDAAIQEYQEALRLKPDYIPVKNTLGVALANRGNYDAAIQEYQDALRLKPDDAAVKNNLGVAFVSIGNLDAAINEYWQVLRLQPDFPFIHTNLAIALTRKGNLDAAIQEYQKELQINFNDADAHYLLGSVLAKMGNVDAAIQEFQEVLRITPNYTNAQASLGIALEMKRTHGGYK